MSVSVFPILEGDEGDNKLRHLLKPIEWKWLSDCTTNQVLTVAAQQLSLTPVGDFMSSSRQDALENLGEEEVEEYEEDAELRDRAYYLSGGLLWTLEKQWFEPREALKTVRGLLEWIEAHPEVPADFVPQTEDLPGAREYDAEGFAYILRELEAILMLAEQAGEKFYLACDA